MSRLIAGEGLTAGTVAVPTMVLVAPRESAAGAYSRLMDTSRWLQDAHDTLTATNTLYEAAVAGANEWERQHPQPKSRKGIRKWIKKAGKVHDAIVWAPWLDLLSAEQAFADAQIAFA